MDPALSTLAASIPYKCEDIVWKVNEDDELRAYHKDDLETPAVWAPQDGSQLAFLACPVDECLLEGNRGGGKTDVLLMDFIQHVGQGLGKDWSGILFRQTFPELEDVIKKADIWFPQFFPSAKYNKGKHVWTFPEGEMLKFAFAESVADYKNYHGHNYPWMAWEELTNWPDDTVYKKIMSLNRSTNKNVPLKIRATTNPSGAGHNWVKARFKLPSLPGEMTTEYQEFLDDKGKPYLPSRISIQSRLDENKVLMHGDPYYINKIRAACDSPEQLEAWIGGNWNITSGGMFDDVWEPECHIIKGLTPAMIPHGWYVDRSYDHGQSKPFSVGFWAESNGEPITLPSGRIVGQVRGDLIRFREWYGCEPDKPNTGIRMSAKDIAKGINARTTAMGLNHRIGYGIADGSIFDLYEPGKSVAGDMAKEGVRWKPADKSKGSRKHGWQQMRTRFEDSVPEKGADGNYIREGPGLFVTAECTDFIRTIPVLTRDKKDSDDVDTDLEDHIADEVRYRCRAQLRKRTFIRKG